MERERGLEVDDRQRVLTVLRTGGTVEAAAEAAELTTEVLHRVAMHDGEVRAALNGEPEEQQLIARQSDFLAALARCGGDRQLAAYAIGLDDAEAINWLEDPLYARVEEALRTWIGQASRRPRGQVSDAKLDRAAELFEADPKMTITAAARAIGVSVATLRNRAAGHPRLAAVLPPKQSSHARVARPRREEDTGTGQSSLRAP